MVSKIITEDIKNISSEISSIADQLSGKTVLISGGAGFLGKYLVLTLDYLNKNVLEKPCKIVVMDNFISSLKESLKGGDNIEIIRQDISKPFKIEGDVHYILHAASIASPVFYNIHRLETIDVGFIGTKNLLELCREKKSESFLFFSSSEIYGDPDKANIPTNEEYRGNVSCIGPRAPYDEPKRIGETLSMTYADMFNLPVKIVRPFNIYGPGMRLDDGRVVPNFVTSALRGEKIPIYGEGANTRTFCYISDAIAGFFRVLLSSHNKEVFNIGSDDQEIQMRHLAEIIHGLVENNISSVHNISGPSEVYANKSDPARRCPDLTKIRTMVGYNPRINLITGLKRFIVWCKEEIEQSQSISGLQSKCRICGNEKMVKIISLGETPLANNLITQSESGKEERYPLEMVYCDNCKLCQLSYVVAPEKMFKNYLYVTSTTETFRKHFKDMAEKLIDNLRLNSSSLVVDIGSNDGLLLKEFQNRGVRVMGVEPANNIAELARKDGVDTINDFLNEKVVEDITRIKGKADVVTANNVFAHTADIANFTENVKKLLKDDGIFVIEVQYLLDTIRKLTFDNIYHEHLYYYGVLSLNEFFKRQGMNIFRVEHVDSHGGSLRVYVQKAEGKNSSDGSTERFIIEERQFGMDKLQTYEKFAKEIYDIKDRFKSFVENAKREGKTIVGYGAPAKATTLLNFCEINKDQIDFIVEDNPLKHNLIVPGTGIPIYGKDALNNSTPDFITILAWNFADEILRNNQQYKDRGVEFVVPIPEPRIL